MISQQQANNENTELEINKSFNNRQIALDLIELLYENSVSLERLNEVIDNLVK